MTDFHEKRGEQRLKYDWLIRFGKDFRSELNEARMYDLSSESACFICRKGISPHPSDKIVINFTIPRLGKEYKAEGISFSRAGIVCRVDNFNEDENRVTIRFNIPLDIQPAQRAAQKIRR